MSRERSDPTFFSVALRARVMPKPGADAATLIGQPVKITQISSR